MSVGSVTKTPEERFWAKVDKSGECWNWTAAKKPDGYGQFFMYARNVSAHRAVYEMENGPIGEGLEIDHKCHNRACVRPSHLRATTHKRNTENRKGAQANSQSGVRGVYWHKATGKWQARVFHKGRAISAGYFHNLADADEAARAKRKELYSPIEPIETSN